jgi:citrate synthase
MTETKTPTGTAASPADERTYSPGLEGVLAGETALSKVDGERGRLIYRGYRIGDLVERGSYPAVANLLWTGDWVPAHHLPTGPIPGPVLEILKALPTSTKPMDALRTAVSAWGATQDLPWPPTVDQARALTSFSPSALAAFARLREGKDPVETDH